MKISWEQIEDETNHSGFLYRCKVPGGWLYRYTDDVPLVREDGDIDYGHAWNHAMTFVPNAVEIGAMVMTKEGWSEL